MAAEAKTFQWLEKRIDDEAMDQFVDLLGINLFSDQFLDMVETIELEAEDFNIDSFEAIGIKLSELARDPDSPATQLLEYLGLDEGLETYQDYVVRLDRQTSGSIAIYQVIVDSNEEGRDDDSKPYLKMEYGPPSRTRIESSELGLARLNENGMARLRLEVIGSMIYLLASSPVAKLLHKEQIDNVG